MSSIIAIEAQNRTANGTGGARATRREGLVPGVVYGSNKENQYFSILIDFFLNYSYLSHLFVTSLLQMKQTKLRLKML